MTIDLGYSFVSLGDAADRPARQRRSGIHSRPAFNDGFTFNDLYSHDFKLGVRYSLN